MKDISICFFGSYDRTYSKNVVLLKGLEKLGIEVNHVYHPQYFTLFHYPSLFWQFIKKGRKSDLIYVAFFGHYDVWFAFLIGKIFQKKVVFDPLISIYNTRIEDRKYFAEKSLRAKFYQLFDKANIFFADLVIIDTREHLKYFQKMFGLSDKKSAVVRVGADETVLVPAEKKVNNSMKKNLQILFYGSYQPSQGALEIVKVANMFKNDSLEWILIGDGQQRKEVEKFTKDRKLSKVKFLGYMSFKELVSKINHADIIFGIFGDTIKSRMVIHNKIYHAIALGKVLVTQDTPAVREILKNNEDVLLVNPNTEDISQTLRRLLHNPKKMQKIASSTRQTFLAKFTSEKIAKQLLQVISKKLNY